mgnify:CR=1 FL=1
MQQVYRFGPTPEHPANHLFVFLHASGADARSMIPAAFKYQSRFPSAALIVVAITPVPTRVSPVAGSSGTPMTATATPMS